jgi:hypothetical protein
MKMSIKDLRAAGVTDTQIVKAMEEAEARRREQNRIAQRNHRARQQSNADGADRADMPLSSLLTSLPSLEDRKKKERLEIGALECEFAETFWPAYPHKVAKPAALKSFSKARKRASLETIMAGLERYANKTDDRHWANGSTWLNNDRWDDQEGPRQEGNGKSAPPKASVLDFAAGFDARTKMQLAEREEIERQRHRP